MCWKSAIVMRARPLRVIWPALETLSSVKCTTAQFDCRFVLCAARSFELHLKMKANLVHSVSTVDRCCCLFASGSIKGFKTIFFLFSIVLYHAGLSIMYNLSYNIPPDSSPSPLHFNLMPSLSSCILCSVWSTCDTTKVFLCCVRQMYFYI